MTPCDIAIEALGYGAKAHLSVAEEVAVKFAQVAIERAIAEAVAEAVLVEREACALICDDRSHAWDGATEDETRDGHFGARVDEVLYVGRVIRGRGGK